MTSFERISMLLKNTGLYRMDGTTRIDAEMGAYAAALQSLLTATKNLQDSIFYDNPTGSYASYFEQLFGMPVTPASLDGVDLAVRREKIAAMKKRLMIGNTSFTRAGIVDALASFGLAAEIEESADGVTVTVTENKGYLATAAEVAATIQSLFPCGGQSPLLTEPASGSFRSF